MTDPPQSPNGDGLTVFNYCASFIDLLAQRVALKGQQLVPRDKSEQAKAQFADVLRDSVLAIKRIQELTDNLIRPLVTANPDSKLRASLPVELHATWDAMMATRVATQRWSDGLVCFASLGNPAVECKMNGVFAIIAQAGAMCLLGLGIRHPVRGSVEIGWGVELAPGEIYGAIVARAYELEALVAGYPRIVVGRTVYEFLRSHAGNAGSDFASQINRDLARKCLGMLAEDEDGNLMVDYLGEGFRDAVTQGQHPVLYEPARSFVVEQLQQHRSNLDAKLAPRYAWLLRYFDARAPLAPADA